MEAKPLQLKSIPAADLGNLERVELCNFFRWRADCGRNDLCHSKDILEGKLLT